MPKNKYSVNDIIDDLQIVSINGKDYNCKCTKCGREKIMKAYYLSQHKGTTHKACGQGLKLKDKDFYNRWQCMRNRTDNPNYEHYSNYGGRGINSNEFKYFIDFYDALYESWSEACKIYGVKNTSLDRIDVNGNYTSQNCEWIHIKEQPGNQQDTVIFIAKNEELNLTVEGKNLSKFCREYNLNRSCISDVLHGRLKEYKGWKIERK